METANLVEAQRNLQRLRGSHKKQSSIAKALGVDQSRISRLEKGEMPLGYEELRTYLDAIGTDEAKAYLDYIHQSWKNVQRPDFWHPARQALYRADRILSELNIFVEQHNLSGPLLAEIELLRQSLLTAVEYLQSIEQRIAFVGDIGVGKSTALCTLTGLRLPSNTSTQQDLTRRVVLYTTTGGATICEVRVKHRPNTPFGILIQPQSMDEIFNAVGDLCASLMPKDQHIPVDSGQVGVPEEINRALRNMAGLARKRVRTNEGKSTNLDQAADLARQLDNLDKFRAEFFSRLGLAERTKCEIWHDEDSGISGMEWLQDTFARVNTGLYPDVSLPRRIDILVPRPLFDADEYPIEIIDTKGVDGTAIRPDIAAYIDDPRVLMVLCSNYNAAPNTSIQRLIQHVIERGAEEMLTNRGVLLILPHSREADSTRDDSGMIAATREESYAIKRDQVEAKLTEIQGSALPVLFFNAEQDEPRHLSAQLLQRIADMRNARAKRIDDIAGTVQYLIENYEEAKASAASGETRRQLQIFLRDQAILGERKRPAYQSLLDAISEAHQRTIWATTRRNGTWGNLDVYHHLGAGVAIDAQLRSRQVFGKLDAVIKQMIGDEQLEPAHSFLSELRLSSEDWRSRFLAHVTTAGRELLRAALYEDNDIWAECEQEYGTGPGYRDAIRQRLREWFEDEDRADILMEVEERTRNAWENEVLRPLSELCGD